MLTVQSKTWCWSLKDPLLIYKPVINFNWNTINSKTNNIVELIIQENMLPISPMHNSFYRCIGIHTRTIKPGSLF